MEWSILVLVFTFHAKQEVNGGKDMRKSEVIQRLRKRGLSKRQAKELLEVFFTAIEEELERKGVAKVRGFGVFKRTYDGRLRFSSVKLKRSLKGGL
ncbi:MAG: HU family DNA-binding protein [Desulfurococcaceae archaeon]